MNTQIVTSITPELKAEFTKNLKKQGLTSKAFILNCIEAFNNGKLSF